MTPAAGTLDLDVPTEDDGTRLDRFLAARISESTRSALRQWIDDGRVLVDGRTASKAGLALRAGMSIRVTVPPPPESPRPESIPLDVVHEDDDLVVVVKPAGLVVHAGHGRRHGTLVNALIGRGTRLAAAGGPDRPGIVHRLDLETSGLVVVAKTDAAYRGLVAAFAARRIRKTYRALVWGRPDPPDGEVRLAIGRSRTDPTRMAVRGTRRARPATTVYRTDERLAGFTTLTIDLVTGRTHQIRVHLASLHHPVVGDRRYGGHPERGLRNAALRQTIAGFERLALHAAALEFEHPVRGGTLRLAAPLPDDFAALLEAIRMTA